MSKAARGWRNGRVKGGMEVPWREKKELGKEKIGEKTLVYMRVNLFSLQNMFFIRTSLCLLVCIV